MKEIYTSVTKIRRQVFAEVAKLAEHGDYSRIEEIPYKIIPGEIPTYRESVFKERAIVGERLRLALGLPLRAADDPAPISRGIEKCEEVRDVYEPPLINVIPFACDACDTKSFVVSDNCRSCLAHPCMSVCPAKAVSFVDGRSHIDRDKCLRCGRCKDVKLVRKPALGHDWGDWIVDQQETDQADGLKHRICKTCGERQDAKIPKLEHIHNHLPTKVEPTCEEQGYTRYTCACGDTYIEQSSYVPALGHIWVETARQQPTEKTVGVITYTCQRCAKLRYEYIPKTEPVDKWKNPYRDVRSTAWYYEDVAYVTRNDLMVGTGTMTFSPDGEMSRAMLVTVLYRMNGSPSVAGMTMPFQDVPGDAWYTDAVTWAYNCGIVSGMSPTTFAPMVSITREQMMTMFYGYAVYMDYNTMAVADLSAFPDGGDVSSWAEAEMGWAVANTLISGVKESDGVYLRPQGTATRAEAAAILHRFDQWRVNAVVTGK